jgi:uncharacterized protein YktA (UPF0223 family)
MNIWEIDQRMSEIMALEADEELVDLETGEVISVADALEKLEMARETKIENAALMAKNLNAQAAAIKAEEEKLAKRRKAIEEKAEGVKRYLIAALTREDGTSEKFTTARAAVTIKLNPAKVVISDEKLLPEVFFREIIDRKPDRAQIKEVLSRGIEVPGAALERGRSVMIK